MEAEAKELEVCPDCGEFVTYLFPTSGWCLACTLPDILGTREGGENRACEDCGKPVDSKYRNKCRQCRDSAWLEEHADELDRCIANGLSVWKARQVLRIRSKNNQKCLCCSGPMSKAAKGTAYFCKKPRCRTAQNRLKHLIYHKGYDRSEALKTVLSEIKERTA